VEAGEKESRYCAPPAPLPNTTETRKDMADFKATAAVLDRCMGTVLAALDRGGLRDDTLVICTTDHGIAFPKMKCNLTDHGIGVMLILRGPGGFTGGRVCDALVSQIDLFPTICDMAGLAPPEWLQGKSIVPLMNGRAREVNDEIHAEINYHTLYEPLRAVRTDRWKYIRRWTDYRRPIMSHIDNCPSKDLLFRHGLSGQTLKGEELYDLIFDPSEACNLAEDAACSKTRDDMRQRLDAWMKQSDDPLLRGPIPAPETAAISDVEDYGANDLWKRKERTEKNW